MLNSLMIVDDNKIDHVIYRRILERTGKVGEVHSFYYAEDALERLRQDGPGSFDLILLDINMPRMNGFEFLEAVDREFADGFPAVVVMLTTSLDPDDESRAREFSMVHDHLKKPLKTEDVARLVALA